MKVLLIGIISTLVACTSYTVTESDKELWTEAKDIFKPISKDSYIDSTKHQPIIKLGEKLYFEKALSANNTISCNSCHKLDKFGVDNEATSPGHDGRRGDRNSPTVYNSAANFTQFWDGRAKDLAAQAIGPILNPIEHGIKNEKEALSKINNKQYLGMFKSAGLKFNYKNVGVAIGEFEKTLVTPSRFDDYLHGNILALNSDERKGLKQFVEIGCTSCHDGAGIGGGSFQKLGEVNPYKAQDKGRFNVTKNKDDIHFFKVPTLRNIAHTAPYFHDGSVKTLKEAVNLMAHHQLGEKLTDEQSKQIISFLNSLTGKKDTFYKK